MKSFIERFSMVLHWLGFLISIFLSYIYVSQGFGDNSSFLIDLGIILFPNAMGWLIRFILTGRNNFFPFGD